MDIWDILIVYELVLVQFYGFRWSVWGAEFGVYPGRQEIFLDKTSPWFRVAHA